jgi:LVIVD repeat-containing protein
MRPSSKLPLALGALLLASCAGSAYSPGGSPQPAADLSMTAPSPDPRVGLRSGWFDPAEAIWNLRLVSATKPSEKFFNASAPDRRLTNSDLAFSGNYAIQGNYSGVQVWDISNPARPTLKIGYVCPGSQSDVSVYQNLLFVSGESTGGRLDCGLQGVQDSVSHERLRGIRIFDVTDITNPKYLTNVQTCRGSHTHTVVTDPNDKTNVYIYVSGSAPVRSPNELPGCSGRPLDEDPGTALFRIEVIKIPLAAPAQAAIVSSPRIFQDLTAPPRHAEPVDSAALARRAAAQAAAEAAGRPLAQRPTGPRGGPSQCHDITVYPAIGLAGGACGGYGLLLDIRDVANPKRIGAVADSNFSFWHSATFNNDGSKVLFSDEWGGGTAPRCRATDKPEWGADAIFTLKDNQMTFQSYYKLSAAQTGFENCVAHNGSLIPIPGRDIMVQAWYQGGISVFDWTDAAHPKEIAYFDRGPMDSTKLVDAGSWSAYWYNGYIVSSEISRGLDIFELRPSGFISQNELDAAKLVRFEFLNVQDQPKFVWPPSFAVPRAYLDQLARTSGLARDRIAAVQSELSRAEKLSGQARGDALTQLATQLHSEAPGAADQTKVHALARAVGELAGAPR